MRYVNSKFDALLLAGAALIVFFLLGPLLTIPLRIPLSYNEGWNAYFCARAVNSRLGPLYPSADTLVFNNYPPLSFYVVGAFGRYVAGDLITAGRIVALASLLASAALLGTCVRLLGGSLRGSMAAAMLLLLYTGTFYRDYVAVDDPQWLGHALMLGGLAVLLGGYRAGHYPAGRIVAATMLIGAGGFVKHSLVGLPIAVTIWLFLVQPRAAMIWLVSATAWVGTGLIATDILQGHAAFADILGHHRVFRARRAVKAVERLAPLLPLMIIAGFSYRERIHRVPLQSSRPMQFAALFAVISLAAGLTQRMGEGVNYNAYFETMIALCLTMGLTVDTLRSVGGRAVGPATMIGFAAIPLLVMMPWQLQHAWGDIVERQARARSWQPVIAQLAAAPRLVACETLSLCFWAGKPFEVDMFNLNQSILTGGDIVRFDTLARIHSFSRFEFATIYASTNGPPAMKHDLLLENLLGHGYAIAATGPEGSVLLAPPMP